MTNIMLENDVVLERSRIENTLGAWSALSTAILTVIFIVFSFIFSPTGWRGIDALITEYKQSEALVWIPCILFAFTYLVTMACITALMPEGNKPLGQIGFAFAVLYAFTSCLNGYMQLTVFRLNAIAGDFKGLELLALPNPHSVTYALEALGYGFLGLSTAFASKAFKINKLEGWIKVLLIINGLIGIVGLMITVLDKPALMLPGLGLWCIEYPVLNILMFAYFRKRDHAG